MNIFPISPDQIFSIEYEDKQKDPLKKALLIKLNLKNLFDRLNFDTIIEEKLLETLITIKFIKRPPFAFKFHTLDCYSILRELCKTKTLMILTASKPIIFHFTEEELNPLVKVLEKNRHLYENIPELDRIDLRILKDPLIIKK